MIALGAEVSAIAEGDNAEQVEEEGDHSLRPWLSYTNARDWRAQKVVWPDLIGSLHEAGLLSNSVAGAWSGDDQYADGEAGSDSAGVAQSEAWYHSLMHIPGVALIEKFFDPSLVSDYYDPFGPQFKLGIDVAQPYRLGWWSYNDIVFMPEAKARGVGGKLQVTELNSWVRYATPLNERTLFTYTLSMNGKFWQGPSGVALPYDNNQIISDFQLAVQTPYDWTIQAGLTPQFNSDFKGGLTGKGFFLDGRATAIKRLSPNWQIALGAEFLDRVHNRIIPYGGVVWTPSDRWEFRLLFPKSRVSYYAGNYRGVDAWLYAAAEYNVDAFAIFREAARTNEQVEMQDYRLLLGCNMQCGRLITFVEGGYVMRRHLRFSGPDPQFDVAPTAMIRAGFTF
jgi:hypothetical protein